jgi:Fur family peroxide stress response transcriptional regulator
VRQQQIAAKLREFEQICRQKGLPLTIQRRVILEAVLEREDHPTADQIYEAVRDRIPQVSRTTVYRVLDTLVDLGLIRRLQHSAAAARFDGKTYRHHHLICVHCSRVIDLEEPGLDELPLPRGAPEGFAIEDFSVQYTGTCSACRQKSE